MVCEFRHENQTFSATQLDEKLQALPLSQLRLAVEGLAAEAEPEMKFSFAGRGAKTAAFDALDAAREALDSGASPENVRRETGWFKGVDGQWRFEITDHEASLKFPSNYLPPSVKVNKIDGRAWASMPLKDALDHARLFAAYPSLEDVNVSLLGYKTGSASGEFRKEFGGSIAMPDSIVSRPIFTPSDGPFGITQEEADKLNAEESALGEYRLRDPHQFLSVLLHEIQHAIQHREGFADGGSPSQAFADEVRDTLKTIHKDTREAVQNWRLNNQAMLHEAQVAAEKARYALMHESAQRLQSYAERESPSGVMRLLRQEMQWIYEPEFRANPLAQQLQRDFYAIPKPSKMAERNRFLADFARRGALLLQEQIPQELQQDFASDKRQLKSLVNALAKQSQNARAKLEPMHALTKEMRTAGDVAVKHEDSSPFDIYMALAGEVEARNVQTRQNMDENERRNKSPESTEDVPRRHQIVLMQDSTLQSPHLHSVVEAVQSKRRNPQEDTQAFKDWFGDSKVVDAEGKPLVVYHGTDREFTEFKTSDGEQPAFFSSSEELANSYAQERSKKSRRSQSTHSVYLQISNPLIVDANGEYWDNISTGGIENNSKAVNDLLKKGVSSITTNRAAEIALQYGFDGVVIKNVNDGYGYQKSAPKSTVYVALRPTQIKSATGNNGSFDAKNPDIRFSVRRLPQAIIGDTLGALAKHPDYAAGKSGDAEAAMRVAADLVTPELLAKLQGVQADAVLGVMVDEEGGTNAIPTATAAQMAKGLQMDVGQGVYKSAGAKRTTLLGLDRVFSRPTFEGEVPAGTRYILVDDTLTQGGTIAALAEHLHNQGAEVAAVVALTGKSYSSRLAPSDTTLAQLRAKLGDAEDQFQQATGRRFDDLTESEARYLANFKPQSAIRARLDQAAGNRVAADDGQAAGDQDAVTPSKRRNTDLASAWRKSIDANAAYNALELQLAQGVEPDGDQFLALSNNTYEAEQALTTELATLPDDEFGLHAYTRDGRLLTVNPSAQKPGHYQLTRFGADGQPWGDTQLPSKRQAVAELLHEADLATLNNYEGKLFADEQAMQSKRRNPQEDTQAFKDWFGDSKVVDAEGKPLVVYHGTASDIASFEPARAGENFNGKWSWGIFFTNNNIHKPTDKLMPGGGAKVLHDVASTTYFAKVASEGREAADNGGKSFSGANVMPAYLSLQNPLIIEGTGRKTAVDYFDTNHKKIRGKVESGGHDGVIIRDHVDLIEGSPETLVVALRPEQIKSATGNNGSFDGGDADIRKSLPRRNGAPAWDAPSASSWDNMVYRMQDKQVDAKRVVDEITKVNGAIQDDLDVYLNERLFHGRSAKRTQDFVNDELNPLAKEMAAAGLKIEDLDEYLHARHAKEANAVIAQRNPDMPDGGSGMTNAEVDAYFAKLTAQDRATLDAMAAKVDAMMAATRQLYVDYELESQATVDSWAQMFQHYVPLMREDQESRPGIGQGISVKGRETKGRTGSSRKVVDILANIAMQRERAIVRGEKNRVAQALVGLAYTNPNAEFWDVDSPKVEQVFNPKTGLVENRVDPMWKNRPNAIVAKTREADGSVKEHAVVFNERNERALRMAESLKNLDAAQLEGLWGASAKVTRYFSAINTQYNPVFGIVNFMRDVQGAAINLNSTPLKHQKTKVLRNTLPALAGIWSDLRAQRQGGQGKGQWAALWDEFQLVGGQTGYRDLFRTSADRADAIRNTLDPNAWMQSKWGKIFTVGGALKVPMAVAQKHLGWMFDMLSDYNEAIENGVRLSAYKAGLDQGMSKERAAALAKNLTVDFNKKGQVAQQAGALYAFFNAAMQGTARMGEVLLTMEPGKPKTMRLSDTGKKIVGGGMLLGAMQAMMMAAAGFDDENPPDFLRERALIIPTFGLGGTPEKGYISIPMPLGLHVIPNLGRHGVEFAMSGFEQPAQRAIKIMALMADAFNPIGNAGMSVQTLTPTALDPLVALTENKDFAGRPIAKESRNEAVPGHALGRDTSTVVGKAIAEGINWLSGGNEYVSGALSPTPDQIDYLIGQVFGGVGREYGKVEQTISSTVSGEALPTYKIPLVGRLIGNADGQSSQASSFYANLERVNRVETEAKAMKEDGKRTEAREFLRASPERLLIAKANTAERQLTKLRQKKRALVKEGADPAEVKRVEEQITQVMTRFNTAVQALEDGKKA